MGLLVRLGVSMGDWRRHAIFFAPPAGGALARFGAAWLGWDADAGERRGDFTLPGLPAPREELVEGPRRYGFHATLKAPFRLAQGAGEAELDAAAAAVAAGCARFELRLRVAALGGFLALVPDEAPPELAALEEALVMGLDRFRAPAGAEETVRRRMAGLDAVEEENLRRWGYPYVLRRFRFHMTLTGALPAEARAAVRAALEPALVEALAEPVPVGEVCRFAEGGDGAFRLVRRFPLGG
jgi:putative phosphonate metabolism protein